MREIEDMDKSQLAAELTNERLLTAELQRNLSESMQEVLVLLPSATEQSILELHSQIKRLEISTEGAHRAASAFDRARFDLKRQVTSLQDSILEERHRMTSELEEAQHNLAKLSAEAHTAHEEWRTVCSQLETRAARAEEMLATERQQIEDVLQRAVSEERQILQERLEEQQREAETKELELLGRISELEEHVRKRDEALVHLEAIAEEWQRSEWQEIKGKEERLKQLLAMSQGLIRQSDLSLSIQLDFNEMQMADTERKVDALKIQLENIVQERSLLSQSVRMLGKRNADLVNQLGRVSAQIQHQASPHSLSSYTMPRSLLTASFLRSLCFCTRPRPSTNPAFLPIVAHLLNIKRSNRRRSFFSPPGSDKVMHSYTIGPMRFCMKQTSSLAPGLILLLHLLIWSSAQKRAGAPGHRPGASQLKAAPTAAEAPPRAVRIWMQAARTGSKESNSKRL